MRRLLLILMVLPALVLPAASADAAVSHYPRGFFGVMVNGPIDDPSVDLGAQAQAMRRAGVSAWRVEFAWDQIEPAQGSFQWGPTDRKVLAAAGAGIPVLGLALRTPAWANGGNANPFTVPSDPALFGRYLQALIGRYGPRGTLWTEHPGVRRLPVRWWEMWNEPNIPIYFTGTGGGTGWARSYARLVRATYPAIKAADPGATAVLASMANYSWRDLATVLRVPGPRLRFDVAGSHPFSGRPSNAVKIVRLTRQVLDRRGYQKVPMWLTELTWSSAFGKKTPLTQNWEVTEAGQARRLTEAYRLFFRARRALRLQRIFWYTWAAHEQTNNSFEYSGLWAMPDGGQPRAKPAFYAFRRLATGR